MDNENKSMRLTSEGNTLVEGWKRAMNRLKDAKRELSSAETDFTNSTNALGKWMLLPEVTKPTPGEKICVWYHDSLIQVTAPDKNYHDLKVELRLQGKDWTR